jgi:alpha-1,3-glucan synthase
VSTVLYPSTCRAEPPSPDWQRQLAKFASVQDRLREWNPDTMEKLKVFSCLAIQAMDIDGIRIDLAQWTNHTHSCARQFGKDNFFIPGEITGGDTFGALYVGRGRTPTLRPPDFNTAVNVTQNEAQYFLRDQGVVALDSAAFHYSIYRSLCRFLGMDGNLQVAYDIDVNFVTAWNELVVNDEFLSLTPGTCSEPPTRTCSDGPDLPTVPNVSNSASS